MVGEPGGRLRTHMASASSIAAAFAAADSLDHLVADAVRGFGALFDGRASVRLVGTARPAREAERGDTVFTDEGVRALSDLPDAVRAALDDACCGGEAATEPGILLRGDPGAGAGCLTWVALPEPREISPDERIVGDLLARALDAAVVRIVAAQDWARREENLFRAVESHEFVGQAVGVLVERYRLGPADAFARLRDASSHRNIKLRELARRVLETGADPETA